MNKKQMLESVRESLLRFGIGNYEKRILRVMFEVDRKDFVGAEFDKEVYVDSPLPTEEGQTISQPSTVARMLQLLELKDGDRVLEVGAGSGWNAALMGKRVGRAGRVLGVEVVGSLVRKAQERIRRLGIENVEIRDGDFRELEERFNKIIFTAGISGEEQEKFIIGYAREHLEKGGKLICPYHVGPLLILSSFDGKIKKDYTQEEYQFVPLVL